MIPNREFIEDGQKALGMNRWSVLLGGLTAALLWTREGAALSPEDQAFATYLIKELKYHDTAEKWFRFLEKQSRLEQRDQADIARWRIDVLQMQGKKAEVEKAIAEFKRRFPADPRASIGNLDVISQNLSDVLAKLDKAAAEVEGTKAQKLRADAARVFTEQVAGPADVLCNDLNEKIRKLKPEDKAHGVAVKSRDQAELSRIKAYFLYSKKLLPEAPERQKLLKKGLFLAEAFVEERGEYPVMAYEAQLQRGNIFFELQDYAGAEDAFSILYSIEPPFDPPYTKLLVSAIKGIRLQAILYGSRCAIAAGESEKARKSIEESLLKPTKDVFDLSKSESDLELRKYAILVRLEYGVALAGSGQFSRGLEQIQGVIQRFREDPSPQAQAFVIDARKAFGRVITMGKVQLRAQDYYEAALGLKSELRLDPALETFQAALDALNPRDLHERKTLAPLCLNEIGEIHYRQGHPAEAALAYAEIVNYFPDAPGDLVAKVAQNYLAAISKAVDSTKGGSAHAGFARLREEASAFYDKRGEGLGGLQAIMVEARKLEEQKKFEEARRRYLDVPQELKKQEVPFYWRAQASAWATVFHQWENARDDARTQLASEVAEMVKALEKIVPRALEKEDLPGAALAALTLGQLHYLREEFDKAVEALKPFGTELESETYYRCPGLGYLVLSLVRMSDCNNARENFLKLEEYCKVEMVVAITSQQLADCFEAVGDAKQAAFFAQVHIEHPAAVADLSRMESLMETARRLIEGGKSQEAEKYIGLAKKLGKAGDQELDRQLLILDAKTLMSSGKVDEAIARFEEYTQKFGNEGKNYEDPYVWQSLAEAHVTRSEKGAKLKEIEAAEKAYSAACALMQQRKLAAPKDAKIEQAFWHWLFRYLKIKKVLGDAGDANRLSDIILFVEDQKHTDMGGLKEEFLKLAREAESRSAGSGRSSP